MGKSEIRLQAAFYMGRLKTPLSGNAEWFGEK
jgi:hypothetical protein